MPRPRPRRGAAVCGAAAAGLLVVLLFAALRTPSLGLSSASPAVLRGTATPLMDRPSRPPGVALRIGAKRPQLTSAGVKSTAFSPATVNISSPSIGKVVGTIALPICLILGFLLRSSSRPGPLTLAATAGTAPGAAEGPAERLARLVQGHAVVLLVKGRRPHVQCAFSRAAVQLLDSLGVAFEAVDVLADPTLGEAAKAASGWPSVPQLYVNGDFIGGCDTMAEMHQSGKLQELLAGPSVGQAGPSSLRLPVLPPPGPPPPPPPPPAAGPAAGPPMGPWDLELRFGKHKGQRLSQVPVAYLRWMKQQKLHTNYPSLEPGLRTLLAEEWEALSDEAPPSPPKPAVTDSQGPAAQPNPSPAAGQPTSLVVPFGRFKGRPLDEVPEWYLAWLETVDEMPDEVREALVKRKATNT